MIATFPHMGNLQITLKALLQGLGADVIAPPPITKKTLEIGTKYAPEAVCLPFKITLGNFIEALEKGADTIVTCGGLGPCRLGYYAEVQKLVLKEIGYKLDMIAVEPNIFSVLTSLKRVTADKNWREIYHAFRLAGAKMATIDEVEKHVRFLRPREKTAGCADSIWQRFLLAIDQANNLSTVREIGEATFEKLAGAEQKSGNLPLRVGIVGEIYVMLESFVNQNLDRRLGEMGVEVHKSMSLTEYTWLHLLKNKRYARMYQQILEQAKPYLAHYVGGHGIKSIGCTVQMKEAGLDGVIQVFPFTCMPEVIAKNILPAVVHKNDIPVMSLAFDEQSGEAGILTRLEAFIDLLRYRRRKKCCSL